MLLPVHYMNVTAVLTPRNILFPRSTVLGMQFAPPPLESVVNNSTAIENGQVARRGCHRAH